MHVAHLGHKLAGMFLLGDSRGIIPLGRFLVIRGLERAQSGLGDFRASEGVSMCWLPWVFVTLQDQPPLSGNLT